MADSLDESKSQALACEFIGTFFLTLTVCLNVTQHTVLAPLSIGAILVALVFAGGNVSGAHYNPAITLGIYLSGRRKISTQDAIAYIVIQAAGAIAACFVSYGLLGATWQLTPGTGFTWKQALGAEVLFAAALVFVVLNVATTAENAGNEYFGLAIGFTLAAAAFVAGPISGCGINPAIAAGVSISSAAHGAGASHWALYLFSPFLGSLVAALAFKTVRAVEYKEESLKP